MARKNEAYKKKHRLTLSSLPTVIITLLACLFCWGVNYFYSIGYPIVEDTYSSPLWNKICSIFPNKTYAYTCGFLLLLLAAGLLQRINFILAIIKEKTLLPFLLFLILNSTNPEVYPLRPTFFVFFPLLIALFELFQSYQKPIETGRSFNITMYLCIGSLIWPYLLWFLPLFWFGLYKFRSLSIHSFGSSLVGVFTSYWFVLAWCVFSNDFSILTAQIESLTNIQIIFLSGLIELQWLVLFGAFFLILIISIPVLLTEFENTLRTREFISFLLIFAIFSFLLILIYQHSLTDILSVFYLPTSLLIAYFFTGKVGMFNFLLYYLLLLTLVVTIVFRIWNFL